MKSKLNMKETILVAVMLFGMFFGAGNLIFPVYMGQLAGHNVWMAILGFILTGVGIPLLGVAAIGLSRSNGLRDLSSKVGRKYSIFFTCALYLTIGPFFAIPRCATVPFTVTVEPLMGDGGHAMALALFSFVFFVIVLAFSLKPGKIMTYVGKILTPVFLVFLGAMVITALVNPMGKVSEIAAQGTYETSAFFNGFLEGYNTMDALAGLAFGIIIVTAVKDLGVEKPADIARSTVKAGVFSSIIMAVIYGAITIAGTQSAGSGVLCDNGGEVLTLIATSYFGKIGGVFLAATVTVACLKTSVGLVVSCSETFVEMFPKGPKYKTWAVIFSVFSFMIANVGLNGIIAYSIPVLMFLYPLAITLILLGLFGQYFNHDRVVYCTVTGFALFAAIFDFIKTLPTGIIEALNLQMLIDFAAKILPFYDLGVGWICPSIIGLVIGLAWYFAKGGNKKVNA
ncbi:MAG: branched-chain amino acid transport system II carrier protein [Firmicutes bacterium]|nr:branched-chain amino acid transport system II carrier protein [Bacillota bacterium]